MLTLHPLVVLIIVVTFFRLLFIRFSQLHLVGMRKLILLKPEIDRIKHSTDDKEKVRADLQSLYSKNDIKPLNAAIAFLIQISIIALAVYALKSSSQFVIGGELLWINDLSKVDPFGATSIILCLFVLALNLVSNRIIKGNSNLMQSTIFAVAIGAISLWMPVWLVLFIFFNITFQFIFVWQQKLKLENVTVVLNE
ncbi:YidC/Oxa1 family membrane protein insertase [Shewanella algae]|uniref:YidC/Oxa1 family membrane protein insertase n=1 Tax=Shewanella algae TaxID=38313 RepID=UPI001AAD7DDD|nr:YidC/Oxa1 family membrane protein insertase [Shewanella algae]MBO2562625.1 YidC/Oxa1 family membrane protein insertase [Shewanella algae]MBO2621917.1 YidC/Oxa1 family membrane protein insertase [Shewanella algae]